MAFGRRHNDDSGSDAGSDNKKEKKPKSRKPPNTAFRQQRLLAYAPILTPKTVLPLFFAVGIIFGPIGGLLLYASAQVSYQPHPIVSWLLLHSNPSPTLGTRGRHRLFDVHT